MIKSITTSPQLSSIVIAIVVAVVGIVVGWAIVTLKPFSTQVYVSPQGPPITSPRIKLSDGRHLAYREAGIPKEEANYKIIAVYGFNSTMHLSLPISQELIENLGIYLLTFDRAGYGESDPYPRRSVKSDVFDIEELADAMQIQKFHVIGLSLGAYTVWGCLKYIPHRLSGATLVGPFVNYWWSGFPADLVDEAFRAQLVADQWAYRVAHYAPNWFFNWWLTQKWFPTLSLMEGSRAVFCDADLKLLKIIPQQISQDKVVQQDPYESIYRDIMTAYGKWEFDPVDLMNPFPNNEGSVHLWQGMDDKIVSYKLTRFLSQKLPWIRYHTVPDAGHLIIHNSTICEAIIKTLALG